MKYKKKKNIRRIMSIESLKKDAKQMSKRITRLRRKTRILKTKMKSQRETPGDVPVSTNVSGSSEKTTGSADNRGDCGRNIGQETERVADMDSRRLTDHIVSAISRAMNSPEVENRSVARAASPPSILLPL